jgi:hypothetical protein
MSSLSSFQLRSLRYCFALSEAMGPLKEKSAKNERKATVRPSSTPRKRVITEK